MRNFTSFSQRLLFTYAMVFALCVLLILIQSNYVSAQSGSAGLPEKVIPMTVGVHTHFVNGHTRDLDMIAAAGIKFIRQDLLWEETEKVKGKYDWSAYDEYISDLEKRGLRVMFILCYNNSLYTDKGSKWGPQDSANIAAYVRWTSVAAEHFKDHNVLWEIWNEPNAVPFWKPTPNAEQYMALALPACEAILKADPDAKIVAPALAMFNWNFTKDIGPQERGIRGILTMHFVKLILESKMSDYLTGFTVHSYRDDPPQSPETIEPQYKGFYDMVDKYALGKNIPLISGEWGYTTCKCVEGVLPSTQANWIARMQLFNLYLGIPLTIWYDWKNDGTDITVRGQNRGLVMNDLKLKPSYISMTVLTHELSGYKIVGRYNTGNSMDFVLILKNSKGNVKVAAWTQKAPHKITFPVSALSLPSNAENIFWIDGNTDSGKVKIESNKFECKLNGMPKYIGTFPPLPLPKFEIPAPSAPELISPAESAIDENRKAEFKWNKSTSYFPVKYHIQIATNSEVNSDGSFKEQNIVFDTVTTDTSLTLSKILDSNKKYFWHVNAVNRGGASENSIMYSFNTGTK